MEEQDGEWARCKVCDRILRGAEEEEAGVCFYCSSEAEEVVLERMRCKECYWFEDCGIQPNPGQFACREVFVPR